MDRWMSTEFENEPLNLGHNVGQMGKVIGSGSVLFIDSERLRLSFITLKIQQGSFWKRKWLHSESFKEKYYYDYGRWGKVGGVIDECSLISDLKTQHQGREDRKTCGHMGGRRGNASKHDCPTSRALTALTVHGEHTCSVSAYGTALKVLYLSKNWNYRKTMGHC